MSFVAACTVTQPAGTHVLSEAPVTGGGTFSSPGGISVALDIVNIGGKTGVCGVWAESESQSVMTRGRARDVVATGAVVLDGEAVANGLTFLRKVAPAPDYAGQTGNCVVSERDWRPGDDRRRATIVIPRQVVYRDIDGDWGATGGFVVWFRPGGPGAHPADPKPWD
ncbi:hypothetical protein D6850_07510 [Roseovarius spongiae]|uniref:Uncharacterized protein n=2 Tax=Roseovarius spongiae TaxID=2320272 RepID=A0A3A8B330_9RHOB|nr:hypothetical protein D6850_07510 [Roseovarius spongiae]